MEIEVGEYVRTKNGKIYTVKSTTKFPDGDIHIYINEDVIFFRVTETVKHSFNIIDLIENTDILQVEISEEWVDKKDAIVFIIVGQTSTIEEIKENLENGIYRIKSIVTKEQMKSVEYKIKEEK